MSDRATIALTGATGFVGQATLDAALAAGYAVRALTRREQAPRANVQWVRGDLENTAALSELARGVEAAIHVAGVVNAPDPAGFEAGNVTGTLNLVETLVAKGIGRFVHVSSLSAREPAISAYGASKARAEKLLMASPLDWTIVRPPAIYGPRDREMLDLFRAARWGVVPTPREGRASLIHVEDLARLLVALVSGGEEVSTRVFEPDDGRYRGWSHDEMARAIGAAVGRRPLVVGRSRKAMEGARGPVPARRQGQADARPGGLFQPSRLGGIGRGPRSRRDLAAPDRDAGRAEGNRAVVSRAQVALA